MKNLQEAMAHVFQTIFALSLFLSLSCFINGVVARTTLNQNEYLLQNDSLRNGDAVLYMEHSCDLVLYNGPKRVWATNTSGQANHSCWAELEQNGNFAVYGDSAVIWSSNSGGIVGNYHLVLLDSGNFAVFPSCPSIWSPNIEKKVDDIKPAWSTEIGEGSKKAERDQYKWMIGIMNPLDQKAS